MELLHGHKVSHILYNLNKPRIYFIVETKNFMRCLDHDKNVYNSSVSMSLDDIFQETHFTAERFLPQDILETPSGCQTQLN